MATWHQQRNPVRYWHETQWTVLIDPPGQSASLYRTATKEMAEVYLRGLRDNNPGQARHASILRPAKGDPE